MGTRFGATNGVCAVLAAALLAGCAGAPPQPVPEAVRSAPPGDLQLVEARQDPQRHLGARVRWGGTVIRVERDATGNARVEVLERRLDEDGRPLPGAPSDGRFVVFAAPSVDPDLYRRGAELTVAGVLEPPVEGRVGTATVELPVVRVEAFQRWARRWSHHPYHYDPYYDPYYHPWYGPRVRFGVGVGIRHLHLHHGFRHHPGFGSPYYW